MAMEAQHIEIFKSLLVQSVRKGCTIQSAMHGISGRVVGIGFKPLWTNPGDSKINGLDINYLDAMGRLRSYYLRDIIDFDVVSYDGKNIMESSDYSLDLHVYSPEKAKSDNPFDKVRVEIAALENKQSK